MLKIILNEKFRNLYKKLIFFYYNNKNLILRRVLFSKISIITKNIEKLFCFHLKRRKGSKKKILIIIGNPRCGSTLIYQFLVRVIDCEYFSNLHQLLPRSASYLLLYFNSFLKLEDKINNLYGHTKNLSDTNEANEMVNFWFKTSKIKEIRKRFYETMEYFNYDRTNLLIIKNISLYDKIYNLHKAVPEILFLHISRNKRAVVESVVKSHNDLGYFNFPPKELKCIGPNLIDHSVNYIQSIEKTILYQLNKINDQNIIYFSYEKFCKNPYDLIKILKHKISFALKNKNLKLKVRQSNRKKVSREEKVQIKKILK